MDDLSASPAYPLETSSARIAQEITAQSNGFALVQLSCNGTKRTRGSVLIDVRRAGGNGGVLRFAAATVDYDPATGQGIRYANACIPVKAGERVQFKEVYYADEPAPSSERLIDYLPA